MSVLLNFALFLFMSFNFIFFQPQNKTANNNTMQKTEKTLPVTKMHTPEGLEVATLGAGCFWCVETLFEEVIGVIKVESGYAGGHIKNPAYREVCGGYTGHAEVVQVTFDPNILTFEEVLEIFWHVHDPTTLNRQGGDKGTQYRSAIFYHSEEQKMTAEESLTLTDASGLWQNPIVTEITPFMNYYAAEAYHQNYYNLNPNQGYCSMVIAPKVIKFRKMFKDKLKK